MHKMIHDCALIGKPIHYLKLQDYRKLTLFLPKIYNRLVLKAGGNARENPLKETARITGRFGTKTFRP